MDVLGHGLNENTSRPASNATWEAMFPIGKIAMLGDPLALDTHCWRAILERNRLPVSLSSLFTTSQVALLECKNGSPMLALDED